VNRRILVTGASSQLGQAIGHRLKGAGYTTIGTVGTAPIGSASRIYDELAVVDLLNPTNLKNINGQVDSVIHIAAAVQGTPDYLMRVNGLATAELAEWSIQRGVRSFVYLSSMAVYGTVAINEVSSLTPISHHAPGDRFGAYGTSKWVAECYLHDVRSRLPSVILRSCAIAGERLDRHFLAITLAAMLQQRAVIQVSNPNFLSNNLIYIYDLVEFLVQSAIADPVGFTAVPVSSSDPIPLSEIIDAMTQATRYRGRIEWTPSTTKPFAISTDHARELGFQLSPMRDTLSRWHGHVLAAKASLPSGDS